MLKRNVRLRKEYLYRKSLEGQAREDYEKKLKIRKALEEGKPIPTDLKDDLKLKEQVELEDDNTAVPRSHIDDEYARAGEIDPKICLTTSRDPSSRLVQFSKELSNLFPNSTRINRGGMRLDEMVETAQRHDFTDVIVVHEHRGEPDGMVVCHLPYGPTAYFGVFNAVMRHDIGSKREVGTVSNAYPHLIMDNLSTKLGERIGNVLKHLFPVPSQDAKRIVTYANRNEYISVRNHVYKQPKGATSIELTEIGPRFELKPYQLKLGTIDQKHAEREWVLRSFIRSAKKPKLGETTGDLDV
ncbi:hypothetical protein BSKO_07514 [Bryopsis sp. KO-2023]|nr:hypothetical protein BSKO_07514 [Bryopsis sp. KO-2023]